MKSNTNAIVATCQITLVNTISERLKSARESLGMSQESLAERAGVSQSTIGNIEAGLRKRPREIVSIASVLGVSPEWLETGRGIRLITYTNRQADEKVPTLAATLARLGELLAAADPKTRDTVAQLLLRYAQDPEDGSRIAKAIELLLGEGKPGDTGLR